MKGRLHSQLGFWEIDDMMFPRRQFLQQGRYRGEHITVVVTANCSDRRTKRREEERLWGCGVD